MEQGAGRTPKSSTLEMFVFLIFSTASHPRRETLGWALSDEEKRGNWAFPGHLDIGRNWRPGIKFNSV